MIIPSQRDPRIGIPSVGTGPARQAGAVPPPACEPTPRDVFSLQRLRDLGSAVRVRRDFLKQPDPPEHVACATMTSLPETLAGGLSRNLLLRVSVTQMRGMRDAAGSRWSGQPGDWQGLSDYLDRSSGTQVRTGNRVSLLVDGARSFKAKLAAIDRARSSVNWTLHIFDPDDAGQQVARHLAAAAGRGCKVRLLLDEIGAGSALRTSRGHRLVDYLRDRGVEVEVAPTTMRSSNHRKVLVVDGAKAFTGGMNVGNWDLGSHDVDSQLEGPAVADLQAGFEEQWRQSGRHIPLDERRAMYPTLSAVAQTSVRVLHQRGQQAPHIKNAYLGAIRASEKSILVATPYLHDRDVVEALKAKAASGVSVTIMLPAQNDHRVMERSARALYPELLDAGVKLFEYKPAMSHHKVAVFDDRLATIGTANLDRLSLECNDEVNLFTEEPSVVTPLRRILQHDLRSCSSMEGYRPGTLEGALNSTSHWLVSRL